MSFIMALAYPTKLLKKTMQLTAKENGSDSPVIIVQITDHKKCMQIFQIYADVTKYTKCSMNT